MRTRSELLDEESSEPPQAASPRVRADAAKAAAAYVGRLESAILLKGLRPCLVIQGQPIGGLTP